MSRRALLVLPVLAMVLAAVLAPVKAQQRAEPAQDLHYRRVFAPADRIGDWPKGDGRYLPIESAEFDRLLTLARTGAPDEQGSFSTQIIAVEYQAQLVGEQLLTGRATCEITNSVQSAAMLAMEPCNLAIRQAVWLLPDENVKSDTTKAILGLGRNGKLQLVVPRSGKLSFDWSLTGQRDASGAVVFSCEFPACPVSVLRLDLPANFTPAVDKGLVSGAEAAADGRRRWKIELGGNSRFRLRLAPPGAAEAHPPLAMLRESSAYDFSPRGVDLSVQWKIQTHNEPLEKIVVLLDPGLQLATARLGDASLPWTIEPLPGDAGARAVLSLPEPIRNTERILRLGALAPLTLNRSFRLPRIRPEGLFWQEGNTTLIVPDPLLIQALMPVNCSQTAVGPLAEPRVGESLQFQNFSPDATIELSLVRRQPLLQLLSATAVELGTGQMTARIAADFRCEDSAQFTLEADVSKSWIIDSVETIPPESLADWSVEGQQGKQRTLLIRLSKAPSAPQPVRLVINGRRLRTFLTQQWDVGDLLPLRFTAPVENKRLAAIRATDPYELKLSNSEQLVRLNARNLTPQELDLFSAPPAGLLFEDNPGAADLKIALQSRKPTFSGTVLVEAGVNKNRLQETYILRCVPESAGIDRVIVQLSQTGDVPPRWTLPPENEQPLSVRQWSKSEQTTAGLGISGEIWELTLPKPRNTPFEIHGTRTISFGGSSAACLASLPEAAGQRGTLIIRASGDESLHIDNRRLKPIPPEPVPADQFSTIRATFRFDPVHDVTLADQPALILSAGKVNLPPICVRNCRLQSWYEPQGGARHLAAFELQNTGGDHIKFVLPTGISTQDVRGVWIDDVPVEWQKEIARDSTAASEPTDNVLSAPLPANKQFPTVSVHFITHESALRTFGSLSPPFPEVKLPVLAGTWTLWLPPGYEVVADPRWTTPPRPEMTCTRRLFGPLGRNPGQKTFNPLAAGDWLAFDDNQTQSQSTEFNSHWPRNSLPGFQPADTQGWTARCLEISAAKGVHINYVHRRASERWAALIFLITLAAGYWKAASRPIFFSILTGIFGVLAFILPEAYVPLASAAVLGMFACLLLLIIRFHLKTNAPAITPDQNPSQKSSLSSTKSIPLAGQAGMVLLAVAASVFFARNVLAEEAADNPKSAAASDYRVFVPIDAEKKPVGDKLYLPENFYNELYRRAARAKKEPQGWLLASAVYRASLVREAATGRLAPEAIVAQFDLHVFGRMVQVKIPFHRENAQLISDSAAIDGRPIQPQWESDGSALRFDVEEPGDYRLKLGFRPAPRGQGPSAGFDMAIPRLPQSRLELMLPADVPGIEVSSAIGAVRIETDPPRLFAELGPSNRLAVHWPETSASGSMQSPIDAEQLVWLKVQSGSVVVDARLKFHISENQVRRLQLAADPRLRLLPLQGKDAPSVQIRSDGAKQQIVTLQWNRPLADDFTLDLSFLLTGASGVGKFRLPQFELLDARTARRWLAVSVDPLLEFDSQHSPGLEAATTAEFLKNWGPANSPPLQAYRLENDKMDWSLSTRPRQPEISAQQSLALSYDQSNVEAYFDAQVTVASGYVFQYQLSAPAAMKVLIASVRKEGDEQAARWSQDQDGTITIFLTGPADGEQQLSLHGIMPLESGEKTTLPNISLQRCRLQSTAVRVFRREDVNLELILPDANKSPLSLGEGKGEGKKSPLPLGEGKGEGKNSPLPLGDGKGEGNKSPLPLGEGKGEGKNSPLPTNLRSLPPEGQGDGITERGRLVNAFLLEGDNPVQGDVHLTPNRPNIDAKQVTRLHQDGQQWIAQAEFVLGVTDGVADQFWIDAPDSWKEPYTVDPPATLKIMDNPGETRQLIVQPKSAVRGDYSFRIAGVLEIDPGQPTAAPEILLRKTKQYSRRLVLPRQLKGQPIDWETHGLRLVELPLSLATPADHKDNFIYEVVGEPAQAVLRAHKSTSDSAKIRLADIQLAWQADGLCRGTAVFDLEPGGQTSCPLNLPDAYGLVRLSIDTQPVAPLALGPGKWKFPLVSERLPQRIEVLFQGALSDPLHGGLCNFTAPSLGDLPVMQTLWTIYSPPSLMPETGNGEKMETLIHQQLIRFRDAAAMITSAENLLPSDDAEETLRWYQIKSRYLTDTRTTLQKSVGATVVLSPRDGSSTSAPTKVQQEIETVDQDQAEFAKRIGLSKVFAQLKAESPATTNAANSRRQFFDESANTVRYAVDGQANSITVNYKTIDHFGLGKRFFASLCLAGVVFLSILGIRRGTWTALLKNRPYAVAIAAGLAWWCWLWPSILGFAFVLVCLMAYYILRRRRSKCISST